MAATIAEGGRRQARCQRFARIVRALCPRLGRNGAAGSVFNRLHGKPTSEKDQPCRLLALLAMASALGVAVAIALAGVAMLLAAPAYAGEGSLLLERRGAMAEAEAASPR